MDRRLYCISSRAHQERASSHDSLGDGLTISQKELSYKTLHWTVSGTLVYVVRNVQFQYEALHFIT